MHLLAPRYPTYAWASNVGYATSAHLGGIGEHGITPHHRRSFVACRQLSLEFGAVEVDVSSLAAMAEDEHEL